MANVGTLYSSVRGLGTAIKDVGRLREILVILGKHGFGAAVMRLGLEETVGVKNLVSTVDDENIRFTFARRLRRSIEELGPTFVKLGQILSTRPDLVPADVAEELQNLQDNVPVLSYEEVRLQVESELGKPIAEAFGSFEEVPLASASIAQVHKATLPDGQVVVVKVQRPSIAKRIDSDLNILHFLARQVERNLPDLAMMDPAGIVSEFERAIRKELDFRNERRNMAQFSKNFEDFEGLRAPLVYPEYCTAKVLTMEFIDGVKVTQAAEKLDADPYVVAPRMLQALFKMVFKDSLFHGDLHPGNILILADSTIVLIDFGLVGRLTRQQSDDILDILIGLSRNDYQLIARVFFDIGVKQKGVVYDFGRFEADTIEVIDRHVAGRTLQEIDVGAFFSDLVAGAIRHQIKLPPTYTMVFKALMTVEGIGKSLAPEINFIEEAHPFVEEMLMERYSPQKLLKEAADTLSSLSRFMRRFPRVATRLLEDVSEGRLSGRIEVQGLEQLIASERRGRARQSRAMILSSCILGGTIALNVPGMDILGVNAVSIVLFLCAGMLGVMMALGWLRS